jgi:hypothetical protein
MYVYYDKIIFECIFFIGNQHCYIMVTWKILSTLKIVLVVVSIK